MAEYRASLVGEASERPNITCLAPGRLMRKVKPHKSEEYEIVRVCQSFPRWTVQPHFSVG
jgi:hypothetical protein